MCKIKMKLIALSALLFVIVQVSALPHHAKLSAVSSATSDKTAQTLARSVSKRIAEIKARERERREEKLEASAKKITGETPRDRKELVDQVFHPSDEAVALPKNAAESLKKASTPENSEQTEDPFAALKVDFNAEQKSEFKSAGKDTEFLKARKASEPKVAQDTMSTVDQELKKREKEVVAAAGSDKVDKSDFVYDVEKIDGMKAIEKDAVQSAQQERTAAVTEAAKTQEELKKKKRRLVIKKEDPKAKKAAAAAPAVPEKKESLVEAVKKVQEGEDRKGFDNTFQALGKIWAAKTHDEKLNSELAEEVKVNRAVTKARLAKAIAIEENNEADALDDIDKQWKHQFPGSSAQDKTQPRSEWSDMDHYLAGAR